MVIVQEATETLTHFDLSYSLRHHPADNLVADPLMAALVVVVSHVLGNRPTNTIWLRHSDVIDRP